MPFHMQKKRKWERYGCLIPCRIIPVDHPQMTVSARIINIGRGGLLVEADYNFNPDDRVSIRIDPDSELERFDVGGDIQGTVRWGQIDPASLMGLFYVGIEFDDLLPLKQALDHQD